MHETAEAAWNRIAERDHSHPLAKVGRNVYRPISKEQWVEVLAAICKNNLDGDRRVPNLFKPFDAVCRDDSEVFPLVEVLAVPSGGRLVVSSIKGGFSCTWEP